MKILILYLIATTAYGVVLLWLLAPIWRVKRRTWLGWLGTLVAVVLLSGNLFLPFAWPVLLPIASVNRALANDLVPIVSSPRILPVYVRNFWGWLTGSTLVVEAVYPIDIDGVRYRPRMRAVCSYKKLVGMDKGAFIYFERHPNWTGSSALTKAGASLVGLSGLQLCDLAQRSSREPDRNHKRPEFEEWRPPICVLRGERENRRVYHFGTDFGREEPSIDADDGIAILQPEITRFEYVSTWCRWQVFGR